MFGELPKLFGRDFAIGYLLPAAAALTVLYALLLGFESPPEPAEVQKWPVAPGHAHGISSGGLGASPGVRATVTAMASENPLLGTTLIGLSVTLLAILLLAFNRHILRLKEGYGPWNPARPLKAFQRWRWEQLQRRIEDLEEEKREHQKDPASPTNFNLNELIRLRLRKSTDFPDEADSLLPTAFGNAIRAFEVYPRVIYGLDSIPGWNRLVLVIPKDQLALIDAAKARVDLWVNTWLLCNVLLMGYVSLVAIHRSWKAWQIAAGLLAVCYVASRLARVAAKEWGEMVKSGFDVFLPELREKLKLSPVASLAEERAQWQKLSQAMLYRSAASFPQRAENAAATPDKQDP